MHWPVRTALALVFTALLALGCRQGEGERTANSATADEQTAKAELPFEVYDYEGFAAFLEKDDGVTYIVNFWATWCKPCIAEMPHFERLYEEERGSGVELLLVSLDMPSMWHSNLVPFVEKKQLKGKVIILDDPKMNDWIPKIDADWDGGIPATLIYKGNTRDFYVQGFGYEELKAALYKVKGS